MAFSSVLPTPEGRTSVADCKSLQLQDVQPFAHYTEHYRRSCAQTEVATVDLNHTWENMYIYINHITLHFKKWNLPWKSKLPKVRKAKTMLLTSSPVEGKGWSATGVSAICFSIPGRYTFRSERQRFRTKVWTIPGGRSGWCIKTSESIHISPSAMSFLRTEILKASSSRQMVSAGLNPTDNMGSRRSLNSEVKWERPTNASKQTETDKDSSVGRTGSFLRRWWILVNIFFFKSHRRNYIWF